MTLYLARDEKCPDCGHYGKEHATDSYGHCWHGIWGGTFGCTCANRCEDLTLWR